MSEPVQIGEFTRAVAGLSMQLARVEETAQQTLVQATKTNGRVDALERLTTQHGVRLVAIAAHDGESAPITKRDLWVAVGTLGGVAAAVKWLPALFAVGQLAP